MITPASKNWKGDDATYRAPIDKVRLVRGGKNEKFQIVYRGVQPKGKVWPRGRAINERRIRERKEDELV